MYNPAPKKTLIICCSTQHNCQKVEQLLSSYEVKTKVITHLSEITPKLKKTIFIAIFPIKSSFKINDFSYICEASILKTESKASTHSKFQSKTDNLIKNISSARPGDLVTHKNHGVAIFESITSLQTSSQQHDCFLLRYKNNDKLYVPVENMQLLSYYGSAESINHPEDIIDKLGSSTWNTKSAQLKKNIQNIADELIKIAAERQLNKAPVFTVNAELMEKFNKKFLYCETEDQLNAIEQITIDLQKGSVMDRLLCGDVGFGKTEVALRASMIVASHKLTNQTKYQIAILAPTTILVRQLYQNFKDRFEGFDINIAMISRLVNKKEIDQTIVSLKSGNIDIVIGTHALLGDRVKFHNLGLLIIDEEQHFGVTQKEKIKKISKETHLLSMSATPIPRTLQMSIASIKDLSLLTTPPMNRFAINSKVMQEDNDIIAHAILKEKKRGGKIFYVCPRISDLPGRKKYLEELIPDIKIAVAHGQLAPKQIEDIINDFLNRKYDLLLTTTIIESGIDFPQANTMIIYKSELFGLSQLYQLKGRVGRSDIQAYCYFTFNKYSDLSINAKKRLEAISSITELGGGFEIASYDMEIRGTGNILGSAQSGHIKEIGVELYHSMLEEAVDYALTQQQNKDESLSKKSDEYTPKININIPLFIPTEYINNFTQRMEIYKKISDIRDENYQQTILDELLDRFGEPPQPVFNLVEIALIKSKCLTLNIEVINVGTKAISMRFFNNYFAKTTELLTLLQTNNIFKINPEHSLIVNISHLEKKNDPIYYNKLILEFLQEQLNQLINL